METIKLALYEFKELSAQAKEKALQEFAYINVDYDWYTFTIEDFKNVCATIVIEIDVQRTYFRGFYSQGDGSSFQATVDIPQLTKAILNQAWVGYAPNLQFNFPAVDFDSRLIRLFENESLDANPNIVGSERWYSVTADLSYQLPYTNHCYNRTEAELEKLETWLQAIADKLNRYLFKSLQAEYEHQTEEKAIVETIEANEYQFTADGKSATRLKNLAKAI